MSYARDHLIPLVDEGLGNSAYLADLGDGRALAIDASRDLRTLRQAASGRGLKVAFAADTHLHADFLSGAVQLAADDGATVLASAAGQRRFPHTRLADGDEVDLGGLTLRALAISGHVPGAVHVELGDLPDRLQSVPSGAVVMCGHGERAMTAASLLQAAGHRGLAVLAGGVDDCANATGLPLETGR